MGETFTANRQRGQAPAQQQSQVSPFLMQLIQAYLAGQPQAPPTAAVPNPEEAPVGPWQAPAGFVPYQNASPLQRGLGQLGNDYGGWEDWVNSQAQAYNPASTFGSDEFWNYWGGEYNNPINEPFRDQLRHTLSTAAVLHFGKPENGGHNNNPAWDQYVTNLNSLGKPLIKPPTSGLGDPIVPIVGDSRLRQPLATVAGNPNPMDKVLAGPAGMNPFLPKKNRYGML
jgi:hypothetical protein